MASAVGSLVALIVIISVAWLVVSVVALAKIASKAGYSPWWCLVYLVPVANVVVFFIFAFSEWPIRRQLGLTPPTASSTPAARTRSEGPSASGASAAAARSPAAGMAVRWMVPVAGILLFVDLFLNWNQQCTSFGGAQICASSSGWDHGLGVLTGLLLIALLAWIGVQAAEVEIRLADSQGGMLTVALASASAVFAFLLFVTNTSHVHIFGWIGLLLTAALGWATYREWAGLKRGWPSVAPEAAAGASHAPSPRTLAEQPYGPSVVALDSAAESSSTRCSGCGAENPRANRFCSRCGAALKSIQGDAEAAAHAPGAE